ncbi:MAG: crossover junction endodeoxyribonuclease RuvC, partial [candidate division Zixibacteria bacterium]|nr:crossover junction endodeoxyribonuclease RuvC [candidate division Zixibacteria bacterium]
QREKVKLKLYTPLTAGGRYLSKDDLVILGIDPGSTVTGYGVVKGSHDKAVLIDYGTIKVSYKKPLSLRLEEIYSGITDVISRIKPDQLAIEEAFYSKNAKSALVMGQVRGVALLAGAQAKIPIAEYSPREVKSSIVGTGAASKTQVQYMVKNILQLKNLPEPEDASDALAIALCHLNKLVSKKRIKEMVRKTDP